MSSYIYCITTHNHLQTFFSASRNHFNNIGFIDAITALLLQNHVPWREAPFRSDPPSASGGWRY